jgi:hypothetical protein
MKIQQQKLSALLASNASTMVSSQNKTKSPASKFFTNINHRSYNMPLVWNHFALHKARRYIYNEQNRSSQTFTQKEIINANHQKSKVHSCLSHIDCFNGLYISGN